MIPLGCLTWPTVLPHSNFCSLVSIPLPWSGLRRVPTICPISVANFSKKSDSTSKEQTLQDSWFLVAYRVFTIRIVFVKIKVAVLSLVCSTSIPVWYFSREQHSLQHEVILHSPRLSWGFRVPRVCFWLTLTTPTGSCCRSKMLPSLWLSALLLKDYLLCVCCEISTTSFLLKISSPRSHSTWKYIWKSQGKYFMKSRCFIFFLLHQLDEVSASFSQHSTF